MVDWQLRLPNRLTDADRLLKGQTKQYNSQQEQVECLHTVLMSYLSIARTPFTMICLLKMIKVFVFFLLKMFAIYHIMCNCLFMLYYFAQK